MIKLTIGNNVARNTKIVSANDTIGSALEAAGLTGTITVNGSVWNGDRSTPLGALAKDDTLYVLQIAKADNAQTA